MRRRGIVSGEKKKNKDVLRSLFFWFFWFFLFFFLLFLLSSFSSFFLFCVYNHLLIMLLEHPNDEIM